MQLSSPEQIEPIAGRANFTIFELPGAVAFDDFFKKSFHLKVPEGKTTIPIESIRDITDIADKKQTDQLFIVVEEAEKMAIPAANAFLKALEEPGDNVHYVFLTHDIRSILPTILSRANCFYLLDDEKVADPPKIDEDIKTLAKDYISATQTNLPAVVDKILKFDKKSQRDGVLKILDTAIHLSYKSYLITGNPSFVQKVEKLLAAQDAISRNGHAKLQLIANML